MKLTAKKSVTTPQFEVLLKLKRANDGDFAFLLAGDSLHPYYLHLMSKVRKPQHVDLNKMAAIPPLVNYASSSDDSGENILKNKSQSSPLVLVACYSSNESDDGNYDAGGDDSDSKKNDCNPSNNAVARQSSNDTPKRECASNPDKMAMNFEGFKRSETSAVVHRSMDSGTNPDRQVDLSDDQRAKRLRRAKMLKGHFALKMMGSK